MVHVLCFGNLWQGDDGFGIHVCRRLQARPQENMMRVFEVGLRGLDALCLFDGCDQAILVDALDDPETPAGTVRVLATGEIPSDDGVGIHTAGVNYLLQTLTATHPLPPPVTFIGAVVAGVTPFSDRLSPALAPAVEIAVSEVMRHIPTVSERVAP